MLWKHSNNFGSPTKIGRNSLSLICEFTNLKDKITDGKPKSELDCFKSLDEYHMANRTKNGYFLLSDMLKNQLTPLFNILSSYTSRNSNNGLNILQFSSGNTSPILAQYREQSPSAQNTNCLSLS